MKKGVNEKRKIIRIILRIIMALLFLLLVWILLDSLIFRSKVTCDKILEFKEVDNCGNECQNNCVKEGYSENLNHTLFDVKFVAEETRRNTICLCNCVGCIENY